MLFHEYEAITTPSQIPVQAALRRRVATLPGRHCPGSTSSSSSASLTLSSRTQCLVATRDVLSYPFFDRDHESVSARRKVNAWICVPRATGRDLASKHLLTVNAWMCQPTTVIFRVSAMKKKCMLRYVHHRRPTMILLVSFPIRRDFSCGPVVFGINNCFFCSQGLTLRISLVIIFFEERTKVIFQGISPTCICRFPCNFSGRVHVASDCWIVVCATATNHSISSILHRTLLDSLLSPHFSTPFPTLARGSSTTLAGIPVGESIATLQARLCFGRWAGQSPLTNLALAESSRGKLVFSTGIDTPWKWPMGARWKDASQF